ncbi:hypothetical protein V1477_015140 [Vespula maculifrons]|uniref:Uncharacterized protein n=1 Tax=Vespula maculifrons TaxID=7453 RepID=A0ABD2BJY6_VESMC
MLLKVRRCISLEKSKRARNGMREEQRFLVTGTGTGTSTGTGTGTGVTTHSWCYTPMFPTLSDVVLPVDMLGVASSTGSALGNVPPKEDTSRCHELEEF